MAGNIIKPPGSGDFRGIDVSLVASTGVPEEYIDDRFLVSYVIPAVVEEFSDKEVAIQRPPEEDEVLREHFGTTIYGQGSFGKKIRAMIDGDDLPTKHLADALVRTSASVLAHQAANSGMLALPPANVRLTSNLLSFDHTITPLPRTPKVVIDYGPGVVGRSFIDSQIRDLSEGIPPFVYIAAGKGPFVNEFLQQSLGSEKRKRS